MATKTRRDLAIHGLKTLGVLASGQTAADEDVVELDDAIDGVLSRLRSEQVYDVANDEQIDAAAFEPLAVILADAVKEQFGGAALDIVGAKNMLRMLSRSGPTFEPMKSDYF